SRPLRTRRSRLLLPAGARSALRPCFRWAMRVCARTDATPSFARKGRTTPRCAIGVLQCVTLWCMSARQFSARLDPDVVDRLERRGARAGLNKSRLAERYIDEGMRMEDHPGIVFRDGPTGRRAGLAAGPDVWEVLSALRSTGLKGDEAVQATAEWSGLTVRQVRDAVGYYSGYPAEIDERLRRN